MFGLVEHKWCKPLPAWPVDGIWEVLNVQQVILGQTGLENCFPQTLPHLNNSEGGPKDQEELQVE